jgi:hypothetical protein
MHMNNMEKETLIWENWTPYMLNCKNVLNSNNCMIKKSRKMKHFYDVAITCLELSYSKLSMDPGKGWTILSWID